MVSLVLRSQASKCFFFLLFLYEYKIIYMAIPYNTVNKIAETCCKGRK